MFSVHFEQNFTAFIKHVAKELKDKNNKVKLETHCNLFLKTYFILNLQKSQVKETYIQESCTACLEILC